MRSGCLCLGLMLLVPFHCEAQGRSPSRVASQSSGSPSGGRDSLLNGAVIGLAAGAALGIAFVYATRDSDLDAGAYAYGALIFGGIGAGTGLGVDALFNRNASAVIRLPGGVALGPVLSRKIAG